MNNRLQNRTVGEIFKGTDFVTFIIAIVASAYGLCLVYSATFSNLKEDQKITSDVKSMCLSVLIGVFIAFFLSFIDYDIISKLWPIVAIGCIGLMVVTMIWGVAPNARQDSKCWLKIGGFTFQSSELLKVGFIISFSYHIDMVKNKINRIKTIIPLVIHGAIPVGLVIITGDAGSALIFLIMFIGMLFFAKVNIGYFVAGICAIIVGFLGAWKFGIIKGIQRERIVALFYPNDYKDVMYQQTNGKFAMGNGGFLGKGFLKGSMTQNGLVPENQNDMILSVGGEEFGFIGAMAVILLLTALIVKIMFDGFKARDNVGYMMCCGVAVMLFSQMFVNIAMELSILPCIGITLPLFSAGGSSSLCTYLALGIVMSVYRFSQIPNDPLFYSDK